MNEAYTTAVALLARREHGALELLQKLSKKGYPELECEAALKKCQELLLQDDLRFAEAMSRSKARQGYGPQVIRMLLKNKGLDEDIIHEVMASAAEDWEALARTVWQKKFGRAQLPSKQKQIQFLLYRGFSIDISRRIALDVVRRVYNQVE